MVENLYNRDAELASASLTVTPGRSSVIDFLPAFAVENYQLVLKKSNIEDVSWRTYGMQFRLELWCVIFATVFAFWVLILVVEWLLLNANQQESIELPAVRALLSFLC